MAQAPAVTPRIGGNARPLTWHQKHCRENANANSEEGDWWVGGTETRAGNINNGGDPYDVLCHRPEGFREKQKQDELLKKGLDELSN